MINIQQFRDHIVLASLEIINGYTLAAEQLIMGTIAAESNFKHIKQVGSGPARGLIQMEPNTHDDIWSNFLPAKPALVSNLKRITMRDIDLNDQLFGNLYYQVAMCRVHYMRFREPLPSPGNWSGIAAYWKKYYNTEHGAGTVEGFLEKVIPVIGLYE